MNPDIFKGQFTLKLIFDQREWIFEVYKRELSDLRYTLHDVPQVIFDHAQEIGKAIA
jgi:hypothetical protein